MHNDQTTVTLDQALQIAIEHHQAGERQQAETIYRQILALDPNQIDSLRLLGILTYEAGQLEQAESMMQQVLALDPQMPQALADLGFIQRDMKRLHEAKESLERAHERAPDDANVLGSLIDLLLHFEADEQAELLLARFLVRHPGDEAAILNNFGNIFRVKKRFDKAKSYYERALALLPDNYEILLNLGILYDQSDDPVTAINHFRRCLQLQPDSTNACLGLTAAYHALSRFDEAITTFRAFLARCPDEQSVHSNLIVTLDHTPFIGDAEIQAERRRWAQHFCPPVPTPPHANDPDPERKLRIGYLSCYFINHSAANAFAAPILHHNSDHFEITIYRTNTPDNSDFVTERFQSCAHQWREVEDLSEDELETLIRQDRIDILVDLVGHAGHNRLTLFSRRPAPINVTAWGYDHGTGLEAMDYLFADSIVMPQKQRRHFAETIYDLPCGIHLMSFQPMPEVGPLPALKNGYLTLGVLARFDKISQPMIPLWSQVLKEIPHSHLILKLSRRNMEHYRPLVLGLFEREGVDTERIRVAGWTEQKEHFKLMSEIDFQLDTYPAGAAVTGLESLRMGLPLVSLYSDNHASRYTASFMHNLGIHGWVAESEKEYLQIAVKQAADLPALAALRASLRARFDASPLGDHLGYARAVENGYRDMWQRWCRNRRS
ncbi:MAG: tetratricopeptide repeat protein [Magnetococcales bacterium]|nr:tetratricopeptide repeat protein [Magnetococcales bacterium]